MHYSSVKNHLKPYVILARRKTTINHAFAAAIAPSDEYSAATVREAIATLGQDPENLRCAYCDEPAQTWDHVFATVKNSNFSGHGHRLGNLLPCCKQCNSSKGNKDWRIFLVQLGAPEKLERTRRIESYLSKYSGIDSLPNDSLEYRKFIKIKSDVLQLLAEADQLAKIIRENK